MTTIVSQCSRCRHFWKHDGVKLTCAAYPDGVPDELAFNERDHRKPFKGDGGVRFEARKGEQHPFEEYAEGK